MIALSSSEKISTMGMVSSITGASSSSGEWASVIWDGQGTMAMIPISSGRRPVCFTARSLASLAACSMGMTVFTTWGMSSEKRIRMIRRIVGQQEEMSGRFCFLVPVSLSRMAAWAISSAEAAGSHMSSNPRSNRAVRTTLGSRTAVNWPNRA